MLAARRLWQSREHEAASKVAEKHSRENNRRDEETSRFCSAHGTRGSVLVATEPPVEDMADVSFAQGRRPITHEVVRGACLAASPLRSLDLCNASLDTGALLALLDEFGRDRLVLELDGLALVGPGRRLLARLFVGFSDRPLDAATTCAVLQRCQRLRTLKAKIQLATPTDAGLVVTALVGRQRRLHHGRRQAAPADLGQRAGPHPRQVPCAGAKYLAQAILDNSKYAREACAVGKGAHNRSPLLSDNDAARTWGSG